MAAMTAPMVPMTTLPLEGAAVEALCDALLRRLLPALEPLVEEAANRAAMLAIRSFNTDAQCGATLLGCVPANEQVSVEWTFTNTSLEPWPIGCRLRFLGGNVKPTSKLNKEATEVVLPRGSLTLHAEMQTPSEPGPCNGQWQLESPDGRPLSPPMPVSGHVVALPATPSGVAPVEAPSARPAAAVPVMTQVGPGSSMPSQAHTATVHSVEGARMANGGSQVSSERQLFQQVFEQFFGPEAARVNQPGSRERLVSKVWDYARSKQLFRNENLCIFDQLLQRLFAPVLQGATCCHTTDLLPLTSQLLTKYLEVKGYGYAA